MKRLIIGLLVLLAASAAFAFKPGAEGQPSGPNAAATKTTTAKVVRVDLTSYREEDGTLVYSNPASLQASAAGVVTWLPETGATVTAGGVLYELDGNPVYLMQGERPAYRGFDPSMSDGPDVRQLEQNLVDLGFSVSGLKVDDDFDSRTTAAIKSWQKKKGMAQDGTIDLSEIVFLNGPRRAGAVSSPVGTRVQPGEKIMETTSTSRVVQVELSESDADGIAKGNEVQLDLGTSTVTGTVSSLEAKPSANDQSEEQKVIVQIGFEDSGSLLTGRSVDVRFIEESKTGVLAVPVQALLALTEGGYAVERPDGTLVGVTIGMFSDGKVEISGDEIREGMKVVVPE